MRLKGKRAYPIKHVVDRFELRQDRTDVLLVGGPLHEPAELALHRLHRGGGLEGKGSGRWVVASTALVPVGRCGGCQWCRVNSRKGKKEKKKRKKNKGISPRLLPTTVSNDARSIGGKAERGVCVCQQTWDDAASAGD